MKLLNAGFPTVKETFNFERAIFQNLSKFILMTRPPFESTEKLSPGKSYKLEFA